MRIFLTGGTGFLGRYLWRALSAEGHELTILIRPESNGDVFGRTARIIRGDLTRKGAWQKSLAGHDVVINLAGVSIFRRWTKRIKREIRESRILSTENIVQALKETGDRNTQVLNASGIGYYGYSGDDIIDESRHAGDTFLASVAQSWESTARTLEEDGIRVVQCRFGIILGKNGGAFERMFHLFRLHMGATWGEGEQWFSWIHEEDVARAVSFLMDHKEIKGPVNFTSPNPVRNREMTRILNVLLNKRPYINRLPEWFFRLILGEFAGVFLNGQRVFPGILLHNGFAFQFRTLEEAMKDLVPIAFKK